MAQTTKKAKEKTSSRRDEILLVAAKVFADRGIKESTVRDIGEAAGILSGSLYYHFDSKEQIVLELLLPSITENYESSRAICDEHSGLDAIAEMIADSVFTTAANPDRSIILRNEARLFGELPLLAPVDEVRRQIVALWLGAMKDGIAAGTIRAAIEPDIVARAILDGTLAASRWFKGEHDADPSIVAETMVDFYVNGLRQH